MPSRVEATVEKILLMFADAEVRGTFFTLGWVAERHPQMVRRIVSQGHELASHGWAHARATEQSRSEFRADVTRAKLLLEDIGGCEVRGYRAPTFSIVEQNLWALEELERAGYVYSSSIYPMRRDFCGIPGSSRFRFRPDTANGLLEIPITTLELRGRRLPCGGGGYFRLMPYVYSRWALKRVNRRERQSCVFYFHPWELDPQQPRQAGISLKTTVRHYLNLHRTEERLARLLVDFNWGRMDDVFLVDELGS